MERRGPPTLAQAVRAHRSEVTCLEALGAWLATGGGDRAVRLWTWGEGAGWAAACEARSAHRYGVTATRWSIGGMLLASGGLDGAVRVWCGRTLAPRRHLVAPGAAAVRAITWAGTGGARLVAGYDDGAVCVWAVARGVLLARLAVHEGAVHAIATLARGALLLTACTEGVLKLYDLPKVCNSGACEGTAPTPLLWVDGAHDLGALCAAATEDGAAAATGGHDARICLWRVDGVKGQRLVDAGALEGHAAAVTALCWACGAAEGEGDAGPVLASVSLDRTARLWAPSARCCLHVVQAHPRYLTCVNLDADLRYMITGSNDKSFRVWSLGVFSLDDSLETPCTALSHFGLGDLEGIEPVDGADEIPELPAEAAGDGEDEDEGEGSGSRRVWRVQAHTGAINCIATHGDIIATASSDGTVKVWEWSHETGELLERHTLEAHLYPALAADLGAGGQVLLTAGLDGCAFVWDVETGVQLRSLSVPGGGGGCGGEAGGGGVRGARVSPHRPPLLLLATDDGLAPLWGLTDTDPKPMHVYAGHTEAVTCCAWSGDGRAAATGAASGELRVLAPPAARALHHDSHAHDLGVLSCDFAPSSSQLGLPEGSYLLATAGCDSLVKLWRVDLGEDSPTAGPSAQVSLVRQLEAHGGAVTCVRWGARGGATLLATAGVERWARVWRVEPLPAGAAAPPVREVCAVPVRGAGGALAAAPAAGGALLAVGALTGELSLWRLPGPEDNADDDDGAAPRFWDEADVARWLREYIVHPPGSTMSQEEEAALVARARARSVSGVRLLDAPIDELLEDIGFGQEIITDAEGDEKQWEKRAAVRACLRHELMWLRTDPPPAHVERSAPHSLLCPLSHRLMREPARAADGFTYERANLREWMLAASPHSEGLVSPVSGRRLRNTRIAPNYALRDELRAFLQQAHCAPIE